MFEQLFNELNLDGMSDDPADYEAAARVLRTLAHYASSKGLAMTYRKGGSVAQAIFHENECEKIYKSLPEWARW